MYDIIFDFSMTKSGGGLKRLIAYINYFKNSKYKTLFLINPKIKYIIKKYTDNYIIYKRNIFNRLLPDIKLYIIYKNKTKIFYSYGIPISLKIGKKNYLHLSNALPFDFEVCKLKFIEVIKNIILRFLYKIYKYHDYYIAESEYTISRYKNVVKSKKRYFISLNGIEIKEIEDDKKKYKKYMLTIGTQSYKRLDIAVKIFKLIKEKYNIKKFKIIGEDKYVPNYIKNDKDIEILGYINHDKVVSLLKNAFLYISTSEIENSSNALLEAIIYTKNIIASNIESHAELLNIKKCKIFKMEGREYLIGNSKSIKKNVINEWNDIINKLLENMEIENID